MIRLILIMVLLTGCTIRVIDDTDEYDIQARVSTPDCDIDIQRVESRNSKEIKTEK